MSSNLPTDLRSLLIEVEQFLRTLSTEWLILSGLLIFLIILFAIYRVTTRKPTKKEKPQIEETTRTKERAEKLKSTAPSIESEAGLSEDIAEIKALNDQQWFQKLKKGLSKTRNQFTDRLSAIFSDRKILDDELLEELHETLFRSDLGIETTEKLVSHIEQNFRNIEKGNLSWSAVESALKEKISDILKQNEHPINYSQTDEPTVILVVGVNGVGKTTSIGKLAAHFLSQNKKVLLAAADTYRAGAIEQLGVWAQRLGCEMIKHQAGSDPASVAFDAVKAAIARKSDIVLIDTAGRLHNKKELMDELAKIRRVIGKDLTHAPHETWIVIDATTGQNAYQQLAAFSEATPLTGIVVTKLDGTAKGGVVIGAADKFNLPIRYIGVGEKAADLRAFEAKDFAETVL